MQVKNDYIRLQFRCLLDYFGQPDLSNLAKSKIRTLLTKGDTRKSLRIFSSWLFVAG